MRTFLTDDGGQGSAEYVLLFGAIIVIAVAALIIYNSYFQKSDINSSEDIKLIRNNSNITSGGGTTPSGTDPNPPSWP